THAFKGDACIMWCRYLNDNRQRKRTTKEDSMQMNPTGQITSEAQVQAIVSGSQTPMQVNADTQAAVSSKSAAQVASTDRVTISAQAQALARGEINEGLSAESIEPLAVQGAEGERVGKTA
ncbi:MAG: hypothetical protein Q9M10_06675, partial [Mariprofundaceae bacterium]|nr:hypothetical protein [Mariprofundaceae bacterium]